MQMKYLVLLLTATTFLNNLVASEKTATPDPKIIPITTQQPEEKKVYPIAIIGAGAAGTMAVNRAVLNNIETLLFAGANRERRSGCGNWVRKVDNVPGLAGYERTVLELRNETLQQLAQTPLKQNLYVIEDSITSIKKEANYFKLIDGAGRIFFAKYVLMATGIMQEQPHIQDTIRPILKYANGQTVAYCTLCDGHRCFGKRTAVIGYSESAGETALKLQEMYQLESMTILTNGRRGEFSPELANKIKAKKIKVIEAPIQEVLGNAELKQLTGFELDTGAEVDAEIAFVALGIRPNNQLAKQIGAQLDDRGLVLTNTCGETSVPNLFVAGDLRANSLKQIYTAWQQAVECIQLINQRLRDNPQPK